MPSGSDDMRTRLIGGSVVTPTGPLQDLDLVIEHGRIVDLVAPGTTGSSAGDTIDVSGRIVAPGLIDVQINGGWGHDFTGDPTTIGHVAGHLPRTGVTAFVPTIVTSPTAQRAAAIQAFDALEPRAGAATAVGIHFEGPIISPSRPGAHNPAHIGFPTAAELAGWTRKRGVAIVTLAPETPGALDLIARLTADGVVVSVGHSSCTAGEFAGARAAGATMVTHLFNAMAPFSHREPGPIGATLADDTVYGSIICDGIHVDPVAVRVAWRALGPSRMILISDAVGALGLGHGNGRLADVAVTISDRGVRTEADVLAGSNLSLDQAVRNLTEFSGCTPAEAIRAASGNPAALMGLPDRGRIAPGAFADLAVFDTDLRLERTFIAGHLAWAT